MFCYRVSTIATDSDSAIHTGDTRPSIFMLTVRVSASALSSTVRIEPVLPFAHRGYTLVAMHVLLIVGRSSGIIIVVPALRNYIFVLILLAPLLTTALRLRSRSIEAIDIVVVDASPISKGAPMCRLWCSSFRSRLRCDSSSWCWNCPREVELGLRLLSVQLRTLCRLKS